ncbi:MAG: ABC transporter ATP-binding protein [Vicinamibacterales bacterium]
MHDLTFDCVSKKYRVYGGGDQSTQTPLLRRVFRRGGRWSDFWALRDISFAVERGEALGIIGHNGAGKSTILKLLSSITTPSRGTITVNGRLAALIEVAAGFHPELTGRENVYLNGALLGMSRTEISRKMESIVEFAGVAAFIDTPVKRYSSGMNLRLGFAISAHLDPDILLLDEVLAVGDGAFQSKCLRRIDQLKRSGTTIIFVSHNLGAVEGLCDRVLLLRRGEIVANGKPSPVIAEYERMLGEAPPVSARLQEVSASPQARILGVTLYDGDGHKTSTFATGSPIRAEVEYVVDAPVDDAVIEVYFYSILENLHCHFSTESGGARLDLTAGRGTMEFMCPEIGLTVAAFNVEASIKRRGAPFDQNIDCRRVAVVSISKGKPVLGAFHVPHTWRLKSPPIQDARQ